MGYIHIIEGETQGLREVPGGFDLHLLRRVFKGPYIGNNGYDLELALEARRRNLADLIAFGRLYIANPDLVERLRTGTPLNVPDSETFFSESATAGSRIALSTADRGCARSARVPTAAN